MLFIYDCIKNAETDKQHESIDLMSKNIEKGEMFSFTVKSKTFNPIKSEILTFSFKLFESNYCYLKLYGYTIRDPFLHSMYSHLC